MVLIFTSKESRIESLDIAPYSNGVHVFVYVREANPYLEDVFNITVCSTSALYCDQVFVKQISTETVCTVSKGCSVYSLIYPD